MSIATQVQRLLNAKSAIKSSIINKSVSVGETVMLDSYHTYISQIGSQSNIGPADVLAGKKAFGNNGQYFNGTALSIATSANNVVILNGFTAYDSNGQLLTGNAMPTAATAQNNRIMNGYTAYDNKGNLLKGNAFVNVTNATNASLLKGHTAYLNNGVWLNGTAFGNTTTANNAMILKGYTAYLNNGFYLNGTALGNATNAMNNKILTGYTAYTNTGAWLVGNYVPLQVATGTVSASGTTYTISTSFTPKGFMMVHAGTEYVGTINYLITLQAFNTTTVTGMMTDVGQTWATGTMILSDFLHSVVDEFPISAHSEYGDGDLTMDLALSAYGPVSRAYASVLDPYTTEAISFYTEDSDWWLADLGWSAFNGTTTFLKNVSGCSVSYTSTGATISVNSEYICPSMSYVIWG